MSRESERRGSVAPFNRRHFLHTACACAAGAMLPPLCGAEEPPASAGRLARQLALFLKDHARVFDARGRYLYSEQELKGLAAWKHQPQTNPEGLGGHHHHHSLAVLAIVDYAAAANDSEWTRLGQLMHCCVGNAGRALYHAWQHALTEKDGTLRVHLLLNRRSTIADLQSHIPYEGRVDLVVKKACKEVLVRVPEWVAQDCAGVRCTADGQPSPHQWSGRYLSLGSVEAGRTLTITFPIAERTVRERIGGQDYTLIIKGSTVMAIEPQGRFNPLYQRAPLRGSETVWGKRSIFTPDSEVEW